MNSGISVVAAVAEESVGDFSVVVAVIVTVDCYSNFQFAVAVLGKVVEDYFDYSSWVYLLYL